MSVTESKMERIVGAALAIFTALFFFVIIPGQIKFIEGANPSPRFFPQLITALFFFLSILLFISGWRKRNSENQKIFTFGKSESLLVGITLAIMVVYVFLLGLITYIPSTILLLGGLTIIYGQRVWWKIGTLAIVIPLAIYFSFTYLLMLRLP